MKQASLNQNRRIIKY